MEEARAVLERLRRIERLDRADAPADVLLEEVRALLAEAEVWVRTESRGAERAAGALARCAEAMSSGAVIAVT